VAVEDIELATAELDPGTSVGGIVLLSVVVTVVLLYILIAHSIDSSIDKCGSVTPGWNPGFLADVHLTTRPFDRSRGCFLGDALAVADSWPGPTEVGPTTVLADPGTSPAPAR
jgi:hypothetical protein